ncbi:hypothetical protein [Kitasatospora sp. MBT66]|uniref:hypothetical protein n=1 Tax=Kitasatospora sp. MBT66 TaxID=1444769 RepID=UPI0005BA652C|nr:hypothetical protein [Kitasatospora sp. MBT66]
MTDPVSTARTDINSRYLVTAQATQREIDGLEETWALPSAQRCAHCGEVITAGGRGEDAWSGPMPLPGQAALSVPRYHLDRDECRQASGLPPTAPRPS